MDSLKTNLHITRRIFEIGGFIKSKFGINICPNMGFELEPSGGARGPGFKYVEEIGIHSKLASRFVFSIFL